MKLSAGWKQELFSLKKDKFSKCKFSKLNLKQSAKNISDADSIKKENKIDRLLTEEKDKELSPDTKGSINIGKVNTLKEWPQIINDIRARKK